MRMLLNVKLPHQPFNAAVKNGTAGSKLSRILEAIKPEAAYFTEQIKRTRSLSSIVFRYSN